MFIQFFNVLLKVIHVHNSLPSMSTSSSRPLFSLSLSSYLPSLRFLFHLLFLVSPLFPASVLFPVSKLFRVSKLFPVSVFFLNLFNGILHFLLGLSNGRFPLDKYVSIGTVILHDSSFYSPFLQTAFSLRLAAPNAWAILSCFVKSPMFSEYLSTVRVSFSRLRYLAWAPRKLLFLIICHCGRRHEKTSR